METLAANLRAERARRNWPVQKLAAKAGVSPPTIYEIEQGKANPSIGTLSKIADAMDLSIFDLLADSAGAQANTSGHLRSGDDTDSTSPTGDPSAATNGNVPERAPPSARTDSAHRA